MKPKFCYPLNMPFVVSQRWNENPTYYFQLNMKGHNGWDFSIPVGTPVYATHDGTVWFAGIDGTLSETVIIDTVDGFYRTYYAHLSEYCVAPGQKVKRGDKIGLSGNTGRYTSGPHLHYGVHPISNYSDTESNNGYNGAVNPIQFFDGTYPNSPQTTQPVAVSAIPEHFIKFQEALKTFQEKEGLVPYPLVGPNTKKALNKYLKSIKYEINP